MATNNMSIKQNLLALNGATYMTLGKNNTKCLVIPVELAGLFEGQSGCYLDSTAIPLANPKQGSKDTHIVKQSFSKDRFAAMSEEEKKAIPIMGNLIDWEKTGSASAPATSPSQNKPGGSSAAWL